MNIIQSVGISFSKSFEIKGRASKSEYWWFQTAVAIFMGLFMFLLAILEGYLIDSAMTVISQIGVIAFLLLFIPIFTSTCRRLHDTGKSGWYFLVSFVPVIGLILIVWLVQRSDDQTNQYGSVPLQ